MSKISNIAIVGGTHGNEFSGIYLLKKWQQHPQLLARSSLSVETVFANPKAYGENKRYIDADLNRQFSASDLADFSLANYEQSRAKVLHQQLGPKANPNMDLVIDLHNTTSNMGPTLILLDQTPFDLQLAAYVKMLMPEAVVFLDEPEDDLANHRFLASCGRRGVLIEVGPQPQSVLRQDILEQMETMTGHILDFVDLHNQQQLPELPHSVEAFLYLDSIKLPLDEQGERIATVHSNVQDNDYQPINPGDPIFRTFTGEDICYEGNKTVYPAFINEAAYYDNDLAMSLLDKVRLELS
ncbi:MULTISPECIES: aspartoacylase [unclassified Agarivorans]|nr:MULTISPECIES: aspartoacylase [unclassified Agarivorans]MDO6686600.1 aspartoacylase [Agarivorans sp. 3_MG-2023]MDO6715418.1 aspartoacylase [Agarivorans sp. 2_MG-2023]